MPNATLEHPPLGQRTLRFDAASPLRGVLWSNRGGRPQSAPPERGAIVPNKRRDERYRVETNWAWVGWRQRDGLQKRDALVVNISRGGALVFLDEPPPPVGAFWLFVETPEVKAALRAKLVEITTTRGGQCVVRLKFRQPPPLALFDVAVCGIAPVDPKHRATERNPEKSDPPGWDVRQA